MHTDAKKHDQSQDFTVYIYIYTGLQRISPTDLNNPPFQPLILFISKFIQYFNIYQWIGTPCCAGNHGG